MNNTLVLKIIECHLKWNESMKSYFFSQKPQQICKYQPDTYSMRRSFHIPRVELGTEYWNCVEFWIFVLPLIFSWKKCKIQSQFFLSWKKNQNQNCNIKYNPTHFFFTLKKNQNVSTVHMRGSVHIIGTLK